MSLPPFQPAVSASFGAAGVALKVTEEVPEPVPAGPPDILQSNVGWVFESGESQQIRQVILSPLIILDAWCHLDKIDADSDTFRG